MMNAIAIVFGLLFCIQLPAQSFFIGYNRDTLIDHGRDGRIIPVRVYYPSDSTGENVASTHGSPVKFPLICFAHGYRVEPEMYENIWEAAVPEGYIVILPETGGERFPSHLEYARDIAFIINNYAGHCLKNSSILSGRIDSKECIMGHSMGGGSALLAAKRTPQAESILTLAAFNTDPSAINAASEIKIPALIISGSKDKVTRPENHQIPMYDSLQSDEKIWINILGGSHCQMHNKKILCRIGELMLLNGGFIPREKQHEIIDRYMIPWLDYTLKNTNEAKLKINEMLQEDKEIDYKAVLSIE